MMLRDHIKTYGGRYQTAILIAAIVLLWGIIIAGLGEATTIYGADNVKITGTLRVNGDIYYKSGIGGLPSGSILIFTTSCPAGWTRLSAYDNQYVRLSSTAGSTGGSASHTQTYSHTHPMTSISVGSGGGSHTHSISGSASNSAGSHAHSTIGNSKCVGAVYYGFMSNGDTVSTEGSHSDHDFSTTAGSGGVSHDHTYSSTTTGSGSGAISTGDHNSTRISSVLCKKD